MRSAKRVTDFGILGDAERMEERCGQFSQPRAAIGRLERGVAKLY
jgi:hypothetical protein